MTKRLRRVKNNKNNRVTKYIQHPRDQMYGYLRRHMNLSINQCHFKKFTAKQCKQAMEIVKTFTYSYKKHE